MNIPPFKKKKKSTDEEKYAASILFSIASLGPQHRQRKKRKVLKHLGLSKMDQRTNHGERMQDSKRAITGF